MEKDAKTIQSKEINEDINNTTESITIEMKEVNRALVNNRAYKHNDIIINYSLKDGEGVNSLEEDYKYIANLTNAKFTFTGCLNSKLERNGFGRNQYTNGDVYLGSWENNHRNAQGVYIHKVENNEQQIYNGYWEKGIKSKLGVYIWKKESNSNLDTPPIDAFVGEFKNGINSKGLYFSQRVEEGKLTKYFYLGKFNEAGLKSDDNAFYYLAHSRKLFYTKINDNDLVSGQCMIVNEDEVSIDQKNIFSYVRNENGSYKTEDVLVDEQVTNLEIKAKEFLSLLKEGNFLTRVLNLSKNSVEQAEKFSKLEKFLNQETFAKDLNSICSYGDIAKSIKMWFT